MYHTLPHITWFSTSSVQRTEVKCFSRRHKGDSSSITPWRTWTYSLSARVQIFCHLTTPPPERRGTKRTQQAEYLIIIKKVPDSFEVHQSLNRKWHHSCGQRVVENIIICTLKEHGWHVHLWLSSWRWIQLPKQCRENMPHSFTAQLLMRMFRPPGIFPWHQFFFSFFQNWSTNKITKKLLWSELLHKTLTNRLFS